MSGNHQPESGDIAELSARIEVLEIALAAALRLQTREQRATFNEEFDSQVARAESISRSTADPLTWRERLGPHVRKLKGLFR